MRVRCRFRHAGGFALDAAFETGPGTTAIVGPSGSGKTTLLSLVAGLLRPAEGVIALDDRVLVDTAARTFVPPQRRDVGFVFQDGLLFPHRRVRDNLRFGLVRRPARPVSFDRVVDTLELGPLLDRRPATLSGGQARRVALGRALLRGPRLLLLDEPTTGLDAPLRDRVLVFLRRVLDEWRIPTLLVTHDEGPVASLAHATLRMRDGRLGP